MVFYFHTEIAHRQKRIRCWRAVLCTVAVAALAGCIVCCCLSTTATAAKMEQTAVLISNMAGWFVIYGLTAQLQPLRYALQHESNVLHTDWETVTGRITVEKERLQIPKSIAIYKVSVDTGEEVRRLNVRADKAALLSGYDGRALALQTAYGYITAFEEICDTHE